MSYTTTKWGLVVPDQLSAGAGPDVPKDLKTLADGIDSKLTPYSQGLLSAIPAFGKVGQTYYATDNQHLYLDLGTSWKDLTVVSIGTGEIADNAITNAKMADNSVGAAEIIADSVTASEIAPLTITAAEIANALKPSTGAAAGTEALRALGAAAGTAAAGNDSRLSDQRTPSDGSVTAAKMAALSVATAALQASAVTNAKILDGTIDRAKILNGLVQQIAGANVKINFGTVSVGYVGPDNLSATVAHGLGGQPHFAIAVPYSNWGNFFTRSTFSDGTNLGIVVGPSGFSFVGGNIIDMAWFALRVM